MKKCNGCQKKYSEKEVEFFYCESCNKIPICEFCRFTHTIGGCQVQYLCMGCLHDELDEMF
jgi:hypothetical protein